MPRDEDLEKDKRDAFNLGKLKGIIRNIIPSLSITDRGGFSDLNSLYSERTQDRSQTKLSLPKMISKVQGSVEEFFKFDPPQIISSKFVFFFFFAEFSWCFNKMDI